MGSCTRNFLGTIKGVQWGLWQNIHKASGAKICQSTRLEGFCGTWNSPKQMIGFGVSCSLQLPHGYIQRKPHMYEIEETTPKHIRTRISTHFAPKSNKLLKGSSLIILDWQKINWSIGFCEKQIYACFSQSNLQQNDFVVIYRCCRTSQIFIYTWYNQKVSAQITPCFWAT